MRPLYYGNTPVPWTVAWTEEEPLTLGRCPYAKRPAIVQREAIGRGRPQFGKPHACRQRQAIATGKCDLCARPLEGRSKISLSHARPHSHGAQGLAVLQVEPMLHKGCALVSIRHCPSLRRDVTSGALVIRLVHRRRWLGDGAAFGKTPALALCSALIDALQTALSATADAKGDANG